MSEYTNQMHSLEMESIAKKYIGNHNIIGIGTGKTMIAFSKYLPPGKTYIPSSTQSKLFMEDRAQESLIVCKSIDIYFDSADYYNPDNELIKGYGGALAIEKIFTKMSQETIIIVQKSKRRESFDGLYVPVEILKESYGYFCSILESKGIDYRLRLVRDLIPFNTDNGNLIVDILYDREFLVGCKMISGVVEHGFFCKSSSTHIEEIN